MNKNNYAVIMAGGIGSRFWPISTEDCPKQFLDILNTGETLIQKTFKRLQNVCLNENIFIVTNKKYIDLCKNQLPNLNTKIFLCEPMMRNTAPCIAYAAFKIEQLNKDANILIAASDHLIEDEVEFVKIVNDAFDITKSNDVLLTLGINPLWPDTGYGYIQYTDEKLNSCNYVRKVKTFTEKPNQDLALSFIDSGDFCGIRYVCLGGINLLTLLLGNTFAISMIYLKRVNSFIILMMNLSTLKGFLDYVKIFQLITQSWKKLIMFMYTQQVLVGQI